jgi:hypothetical protein
MKKQIILDFHSPHCTKGRYTTCFRKSPIHNFRAYLNCPLTNYLSITVVLAYGEGRIVWRVFLEPGAA